MKHEDFPKVSVVISTFERPAMLDRALASVFAQTFTDYEVIVVDDGSRCADDYMVVFEKWVPKFEERGIMVAPYRLEDNSGYQCFPKNRAVERSSGDYIAYLDDDNEWAPDHLAECVAAIESDFSHDMVYSRIRYVIDTDEARRKLSAVTGGAPPEGDAIGTPWDPAALSKKNYVDTSAIMHSRGAFWRLVRESGYGWDEGLRRFGDWNFVWRWAIVGNNAKLVDKVTVVYHWHDGSLQLNRPLIETPVTFNYAQWLATRKQVDADTGYTRAESTH